MYAYDKGYLPFDINVTGGLSSEGVHIIKHHIVRVPDDDPQLIANVTEKQKNILSENNTGHSVAHNIKQHLHPITLP